MPAAVALRYPTSRFEVTPWVDLGGPRERVRLSGAAVRGLVRLAHVWNLTVDDIGALLGGVPPSTWHSWANKAPRDLGTDRLTRVSYLLGIHAALKVLYPTGSLADEWITRPNTNPLFAGRRPLDVLVEGGIVAMERTRTLLDSRRGA